MSDFTRQKIPPASMHRSALAPDSFLSLSAQPQDCFFRIEQFIDAGGTSLIYKAVRTSDGVLGTLKEFFPVFTDSELMRGLQPERNPDGSLRLPADILEERNRELVALQETLRKMKQDEALNVFIPYMELYHSDTGVPYLFTPEDRAGVTLADYLRDIRGREGLPELLQILCAVEAVCAADWQLLKNNALLLDIKPENILLLRTAGPGGEPAYLKDAVTLFDVDTILVDYKKNAASSRLPFSKGFTAPELGSRLVLPRRYRIGPETDVFALGATLYAALAGTPYNGVPRDIPEGLRRGPFATCLSAQQMNRLVFILGKALSADPWKRHRDASLLYIDLCSLEQDIKQEFVLQKRRRQQRLRDEMPRMLDYLFYRWPCYRAAAPGQKDMRILIVADGEGGIARQALDAAFRSFHILGWQLHIALAGENAAAIARAWCGGIDRAEKWIDIRGDRGWTEYPWEQYLAQLAWQNLQPSPETVCELAQRMEASCVLVLCGDGEENKRIAEALAPSADGQRRMAVYLCESGKTFYADYEDESKLLIPLCPDEVDDVFQKRCEQIAFNVHFIYERERSGEIPVEEIRRSFFTSAYNSASSLEAGLGTRCHMMSAGIDLREGDDSAAERYRQTLEARPELVPMLSCMEHRRWVAARLVQGSRLLPPKWYGLLRSGGQNGTRIRSRNPDGSMQEYHALLVTGSASACRPEGWRTAEEWTAQPLDAPIPACMDELDKASIELYRTFARFAADTDVGPLRALLAAELEKLSPADPEPLRRASRAYLNAFDTVCTPGAPLHAAAAYRTAHSTLKERLAAAAQSVDPAVAQALLEAAHCMAFCFVQRVQCIDYKKMDENNVVQIPFILNNPL